ncbi:Metallo-dependent phosphatase [Rhizoclosmatium globosum]|uniref:Metallo-dependent phosphatase n=1 Tax=Rhizoclosmatium globosum TaxID=329046 RepID=A0A1Y2CQ19_9FUNG|nr:Metallo-dependent phosphatase [Rhizoclosmatium globosum]|eukprot:ORY48445.1 Metallo-dependent phosphatase [Rhizoclosmatium globosum]
MNTELSSKATTLNTQSQMGSRQSQPTTPKTSATKLKKEVKVVPESPNKTALRIFTSTMLFLTNLGRFAEAIRIESEKRESLLSSLDKGFGMVDILNRVGMQYVTLGNHEDDVSIEALQARIAQSSFTWINTNIPDFPTTPEIKDKMPKHKVALLGLCTEDPKTLKNEGIDLVIPLTHQEIEVDRVLAETQLFPVIIGGHDHIPYHETLQDSQIIKVGMDATNFAIVEITWTEGNPKPVVDISLKKTTEYPENEDIKAAAAKHESVLISLKKSVLCKIPSGVTLSSKDMRLRPVSMGFFICNLVRAALKTDVAILNGGTIRGNMDYDPSKTDFTFLDLETELPFKTPLVSVELPGQIINDMIIVSRIGNKGSYFQTCDAITTDPSTNAIITICNAPLDPTRIYTVAMNHDIVSGLDNIKPLMDYLRTNNQDYTHGEYPLCSRHLARLLFSESFDSMNTSGDGFVTREQLKAALEKKGHGLTDAIVDNVFAIADPDRDGKFTREDFVRVKMNSVREMDFRQVDVHRLAADGIGSAEKDSSA